MFIFLSEVQSPDKAEVPISIIVNRLYLNLKGKKYCELLTKANFIKCFNVCWCFSLTITRRQFTVKK